MGTSEFNAGGNPAMDKHPIQGGVEILLVASYYKPLCSYANFIISYKSSHLLIWPGFNFDLLLYVGQVCCWSSSCSQGFSPGTSVVFLLKILHQISI